MVSPAELARGRVGVRMVAAQPFNAEAPPEAIRAEVTPTGSHYIRSNFSVPDHDGTFTISGAVARPTTVSLDDLRGMPAVERAVTLECAGNGRLDIRPLPVGEPWGGYAVSTARWKGALLRDVLELAKPAADGVEVAFEGADRGKYHLKAVLADAPASDLAFERSLRLSEAMDPAAE